MRIGVAFVLATGACGFRVGGASSTDASVDATYADADADADADAGAQPDAAAVGCAGAKRWEADFSTDPELLDVNGDGVLDWAIRSGGALPGSLAGGRWTEPSPPLQALDTQPKQDFTTRTIVDVRMRNTALGAGYGAVFWINVGYGGGDFAPLWIDLHLLADSTQTMVLYTKDPAQVPITLATEPNLTDQLVDVHLDIDPSAHTIMYGVSGRTGTRSFTEIPATGDDRFATLTAFSTSAEFDHARVVVCP